MQRNIYLNENHNYVKVKVKMIMQEYDQESIQITNKSNQIIRHRT